MPFLNVSYWIAQLPTPFMGTYLEIVLIAFGALVALGIALWFIARAKKDNLYWRDGIAHFAVALFQTGLLALLLVWFTQEQIQFFGMRVWFLVLALSLIVRVVLIARKMMKVIPVKVAAGAEKARIARYLP